MSDEIGANSSTPLLSSTAGSVAYDTDSVNRNQQSSLEPSSDFGETTPRAVREATEEPTAETNLARSIRQPHSLLQTITEPYNESDVNGFDFEVRGDNPQFSFLSELFISGPQIVTVSVLLIWKWDAEYCDGAGLHSWAVVFAVRKFISLLLAYSLYNTNVLRAVNIVNYLREDRGIRPAGSQGELNPSSETQAARTAANPTDIEAQDQRTPLLPARDNVRRPRSRSPTESYATAETVELTSEVRTSQGSEDEQDYHSVTEEPAVAADRASERVEVDAENYRIQESLLRTKVLYIKHLRTILENFGIIWLVVGNFWLYQGKDDCLQTAPTVYVMDAVLVYLGFVIVFLPCIIMIVVVPVICLCFPCLLQVLRFLDNRRKPKGATKKDLEKLPLIKYKQGILSSSVIGSLLEESRQEKPEETSKTALELSKETEQERSELPLSIEEDVENHSIGSQSDECAICLNSYTDGEVVRLLFCHHHFHKNCCDEWLLINATCPVCRTSVLKSTRKSSGHLSEEGPGNTSE